ncbi:hypothetical protein BGW38_003644 [Lunasporangiospora selenospora]|uniref:ABC transporter domain-containing protein n=1 Tax=Lunasporangiospora selenospora TaxID=979761 RepID=A0A9P6KHV0_9FUNG|nr:hypothetical protein BGW38_003644 [Lunasporangiospora selenospora]
MRLTAKIFVSRLPAGVNLDSDIREFMASVIDGQSFTTVDALREETEHFLVDAGMEDSAALDEFYASLESLLGSATSDSSAAPTLVAKPLESSMSTLSVQDASDDKDSSGSDEGETAASESAAVVKDTKKKSKPVKMTKAAKKLAAKSGASSPAIPSSGTPTGASGGASPALVGRAAFEGESAVVEAYSQQSRFYEETLETLSRDVDLKQVNITIADKPLLQDTRLWFKSGTMYGLVGRNGTGKSTLLKAIGYGQLIGFPLNIRVLYIEQLPSETPADQTVVETVLKADTERTLLLSELKLLTEAINKYPQQLTKGLKKLEWERMKVKLADAQKTAIRRSGKRGADAREILLVVEDEEKEAREAYESVTIQGVEPTIDVMNRSHELLESVHVKLQQIEADSAESRARELLRGLGFTTASQDAPIKSFSGGWKMRIALAQALFLKPDILLLDEPTNHLDLPATIWLQNYLRRELSGDQTVVVVSHDRNFLDAVSDEIIRLRDHKLTYHVGNYSEYELVQEDKAKMKDRIASALETKRKHKLDRLAGHNKLENGKRFKQSYVVGYHLTQGIAVEREVPEPPVNIPLPEPKELRGTPTTLLSLNNVSYSYPGAATRKAGPVVQNVSLSLHPSSRIALVGPNGCGKSTLMALLSGEITPTSGTMETYSSLVKFGYFSQHNVDKLDGFATKSSMQYLMDTFPDDYKTQAMARKYLGSFGIAGQRALLPMSSLSGGEKARVALAVCVQGGPQILLLDEITNHLDMATIDGLIVALKAFTGAVVMVSHDAYFIKSVCEDPEEDEFSDEDEDDALKAQEEAGIVYRVKAGKLIRLEGGVDEYVKVVVSENKKGMRSSSGRPV